ncbi:MAG: helix-turn-helix transcriptional regulator [Lawsonibacter sp.]|nr:helix-turn-helix transcriptional regulator [Lawsonibacter sp.]
MNAEFEYRLGQRIRQFRRTRGLTQEQLAAQMQVGGCENLTRSALAKIEAGQRHLYPDELRALKRLLRVSYEDLLEE